MSHGRIVQRPDGKKFHIGGRHAPRARGPRLSLKNYLDESQLPEVANVDFSTHAKGLADVLGNDELGDCTSAGVLHALETILGVAGTPASFTREEAIHFYSLSTGYDPSDPSTDQGGDEISVLDFAAEHGIDGKGLHQIAGSILVDACNKTELRWCIANLANIYYGVALPDSYVNPFPAGNGFVWGPGTPNPNNGHCFIAYGMNDEGSLIDTWGELGVFTYEAQTKLATNAGGGEAHALVTRDLLSAAGQKSPGGFAWQDLLSDLAKIGALSS
jgi:hypothetical protein